MWPFRDKKKYYVVETEFVKFWNVEEEILSLSLYWLKPNVTYRLMTKQEMKEHH